MDANLIVTIILVLVALVLLFGGPIWLAQRAARLNAVQEAEAAAFERELLSATPPARTLQGGAPKAPDPAPLRPSRVSTQYPAYGETEAPAVAHDAAAPAPPLPKSAPVEAGAGGTSSFAGSIVDKLGVAGVFRAIEGPLRCANPEIQGILISLKNGKRLGILDTPFDRKDPALEGLLRHLDGLIIEGPDQQPLLINRFQDFLSDLIML